MKRALMIASMASMLDNFNTSNIELLRELGYEVVLAANFKNEDSNSKKRVKRFEFEMKEKGYEIRQIDFTRKILNLKNQMKSYRQIKKLSEEGFELVHCHSPICAAITRFVFRKKRKQGLNVIYTAHGFHFYKGGPAKNWLLYFPIEWICAHWTDMLLTINQEDFRLAKKWMKAKKIAYIPGAGIDFRKFHSEGIDRDKERTLLGLQKEDIMLLSVGELNYNKNHELVIRAIAELSDSNIHYMIAGQGELFEYLKVLAETLGIQNQVHVLGYREDVAKLYQCADIYILPSLREGLNVSLMEAMTTGLPCIVSNIRGNNELIEESQGGFLFSSKDKRKLKESIIKIKNSKVLQRQMGKRNIHMVQKFSLENVRKEMRQIYELY